MAYSQKLINANERLMDAYSLGTDSTEYQNAKNERLDVFAEVALEIGEPALAYENPYDTIMEAINNNESPEWIAELLAGYLDDVECLEKIGYHNAKHWRDGYEECKSLFNS